MAIDINFIKESVEQYRKKLLDISKRNNLISFKHSERSRQHVRVIDELPDFLYASLVDGGKLKFLALPEEDPIPPDEQTPKFMHLFEQAKLTDEDYLNAVEEVDEYKDGALDEISQIERDLRNKIREELGLPGWNQRKKLTNAEVAKKHGLNPSYDMPEATDENQSAAKRHADKFIQTLLKPEEMNRKLSGITSYVRSDIEESGVNTLYAAFGFLEWYESKNSDKKCTSPLLLLQLEIEKKQSPGGYVYTIKATGEEPEINISLAERLSSSEFGIKLPTLTEEDTPESYMQKIADIIENNSLIPKKDKWRVRRFITIGRFRFARLVMFRDLIASNVPGNNIVKSLFAGSDKESSDSQAEDYNIDTPEVEKIVPLLITSADASQHSALVDVMKGKNLAIKGPPGTGKSQTITNIIANALATGKSVLFLAEKMAALNVVYERLNDAGLGPYCLELHSTKAKKDEVIGSIRERLEIDPNHRNNTNLASSKIKDFKEYRDRITEYIDALNGKFGRQNKSIYDYLWGWQRRKEQVGDLVSIINKCKIPFKQADLTESDLNSHVEELKAIAALKKQVTKEIKNGRHPWEFIGTAKLDTIAQEDLKLIIGKWKENLEDIKAKTKEFNKKYKTSIANTPQSINVFYDHLKHLINYNISDLDDDIIAKIDDKEKACILVNFVKRVQNYRINLNNIQSFKDASEAIESIQNIEADVLMAKKIGVSDLSSSDMKEKIEDFLEELKLWDKSLKTLLMIGEQFGISKNEKLDKIYALAEMTNYISSVPRDYLLLREDNIIDEKNATRLKKAVEKQEQILSSLKDQEYRYNLSMMGPPHEIRMNAAALDNAGFFAIFDSSYRQAKKIIKLASKQKFKFDAQYAANTLRSIADSKEEKEKIEQDNQLKEICGDSFEGIETDFKKLQEINDWAKSVRKRYASGDEFSRNIRQWLLKASMEEIDTARDLADDDNFIALKNKMQDIEGIISSDMTVKKYIKGLVEKTEKLNQLKEQLESISSSATISFATIAEDLPNLKSAKEALDSSQKDSTIKKIFGDEYKGLETNIKNVEEITQFINDCLSIPELENGFDNLLKATFSKTWKQFKEQLLALTQIVSKATDTGKEVSEYANINFSPDEHRIEWLNLETETVIKQLSEALKKSDALDHWVGLNTRIAKAYKTIKGDLLQAYEQENINFEALPISFEYMIYDAIAREIYNCYPVISETRGISLEQARAKIKKLDKEIQNLQKQELCNKLNASDLIHGNRVGNKSAWTEDALIYNEISKEMRYIPIRSLMKRAGQSIQKIKPCFLMSPLTVAQYLEPNKFKFDIVVIDEASQMRPEDALGGIARANQIVVVGDPQQLPPTSFFQSSGKDDEAIEDRPSDAIMDMALSSFRPSRILSRHYRSQHESLIEFSNHHFYGKSLILFPSPIKSPEKLGVRMEYVKGATYTASLNIDEAKAVVEAALKFMRDHPDRSLGIATMNQQQRDWIFDEMEEAFRLHPHASKYRDSWQGTLESFFVKNLESVQGDERDAIFISTVYGPDKNGTVMQRFGPINSATGHRRLNVLLSRAKKNMVIFTSLEPEDIKISNTSSKGMQALKGFLTYASKGVIDEGNYDPEETPDSDFEAWVKEKLESIGCEAHSQVGVAGYRIDLGVKHPKYPYGYLVGVECDGATYHSSKSARERDIIRQDVLEGLGWRIYRIWSTDWFSNPVKEFEKLESYIEELVSNEELQKMSDVGNVIEADFTLEQQDGELDI